MYILFRCLMCDALHAWPANFADGNRCDCGGHLRPVGKGGRDELQMKYGITQNKEIILHKRKVKTVIENVVEVLPPVEKNTF